MGGDSRLDLDPVIFNYGTLISLDNKCVKSVIYWFTAILRLHKVQSEIGNTQKLFNFL